MKLGPLFLDITRRGHYVPLGWSAQHVLFTSRWGEMLIVDRRTGKSFYEQEPAQGECDRLGTLTDTPSAFDAVCADLLEASAGHLEPTTLPISVTRWLEANPCKS